MMIMKKTNTAQPTQPVRRFCGGAVTFETTLIVGGEGAGAALGKLINSRMGFHAAMSFVRAKSSAEKL
ncbi:MAG: hypothetical protein AAGK14_00165 [Verrucomicrobiota bacterium]